MHHGKVILMVIAKVRNLIKFRPDIYSILGLLLLILSGVVSISGLLYKYGYIDMPLLVSEFYANIGSELAGIAITILLIDSIARRRAEQERMKLLVLQAGSTDNSIASEAIRQLKVQGWLARGALRNANLERANLRGVDLENADMKGIILDGADLTDANLFSANLEGASLFEARLCRADLPLANLSGASLVKANLEGAVLDGADLRGATLESANLIGVRLENTRMNEDTILPDGTRWSPYIDVSKFTRPSR